MKCTNLKVYNSLSFEKGIYTHLSSRYKTFLVPQPSFHFLSLWVSLLVPQLYINEILGPAFFTQHIVCEVHLCYCLKQ